MEPSEILTRYEAYLLGEKCMRPRSARDYLAAAADLSKTLNLLGELSYKQINDCLRDMKERAGWSQGTVYKYSVCVRHFFRWLQREQYRPDNPYPFAEWRKPRPATPKFLTQTQFDALVADPHLTHQEMALLYMLWDTGARIGELATLQQEFVNLDTGIVNLPYEITKGNYSYRNVPISARAIELLKGQAALLHKRGHHKAWFINAKNEPMTVQGLQKAIYAIGLRSSPLRPAMRLSAHQFRHSFGIRMLEKSVPQVIVQKWLGHQSLQMTARYVNMDAESSRKMFEMYCQPA